MARHSLRSCKNFSRKYVLTLPSAKPATVILLAYSKFQIIILFNFLFRFFFFLERERGGRRGVETFTRNWRSYLCNWPVVRNLKRYRFSWACNSVLSWIAKWVTSFRITRSFDVITVYRAYGKLWREGTEVEEKIWNKIFFYCSSSPKRSEFN